MSLSLAKREVEEEENSEVEGAETTSTKDQICSASVVERLDTNQISVGVVSEIGRASCRERVSVVV